VRPQHADRLGRTQPHETLIQLLAAASKYGHIGTNVAPSDYYRRYQTAQDVTRMRNSVILVALVLALSGVAAPASAKGCIKGAIVGGAAGHYAHHHGVLGAAAGCLIGRHYAHKHTRESPSRD